MDTGIAGGGWCLNITGGMDMKMKGKQSGRSDRVLFVDQLLSAIRKSVRDRRIKRVGIVLAGIVVFVTTYSLILPALTLEEDTLSQLPGL